MGGGPSAGANPAEWFDQLSVGAEDTSPAWTLTDAQVSQAISISGYGDRQPVDATNVCPLGLARRPLPGGLLLALVGSLAERCSLLATAPTVLTGFDGVELRRPVFAGDTLRVQVRVVAKRATTSGRRLVVFAWVATNQGDDVVVFLEASSLLSPDRMPPA